MVFIGIGGPAAMFFAGPNPFGQKATAIAAEYQGQNIDGQRFAATAQSRETGGVYDVEVEFKGNKATLYFEGGSRQRIRLNQAVITDPKEIYGWGRPFTLNIGGVFNIGLTDRLPDNLEDPSPRPLAGYWRIRLNDGALDSLEPQSSNLEFMRKETRHWFR